MSARSPEAHRASPEPARSRGPIRPRTSWPAEPPQQRRGAPAPHGPRRAWRWNRAEAVHHHPREPRSPRSGAGSPGPPVAPAPVDRKSERLPPSPTRPAGPDSERSRIRTPADIQPQRQSRQVSTSTDPKASLSPCCPDGDSGRQLNSRKRHGETAARRRLAQAAAVDPLRKSRRDQLRRCRTRSATFRISNAHHARNPTRKASTRARSTPS